MRYNCTQSSPTAHPDTRVNIAGDMFASIELGFEQPRLLSYRLDESVTGGRYEVVLDNDDDALTYKNYKGNTATVYFGFVDELGSSCHILRVIGQDFSSEEGKKVMIVTLVDQLSRLAYYKGAVGGTIWNHPHQSMSYLNTVVLPSGAPLPSALKTAINNQYDKTAYQIISTIVTNTLGVPTVLSDDDGLISTRKPLVSAQDARSAIFQALRVTKSYLKNEGNWFEVIQPDAHEKVYDFDIEDLYFKEIDEQQTTIPNKVVYHGIDSGGNLIATQSPHGEDAESISLLGEITEHNNYDVMDRESLTTQAEVDDEADARLANIKLMLNTGTFTAPMHCSLELFDRIALVDSKYTPAKEIEGYVFRIIREYNRGVYKITVQLGGRIDLDIFPFAYSSLGAVGGGKGLLTRTPGTTTDNWYSGTATSGETGEDVLTINSNDTNLKVVGLLLDVTNLSSGATYNIRLYHQINGVERCVYSQNYVRGTDPDGVWLISGSLTVSEALRVELQSMAPGDTSKQIAWEWIKEE